MVAAMHHCLAASYICGPATVQAYSEMRSSAAAACVSSISIFQMLFSIHLSFLPELPKGKRVFPTLPVVVRTV